MKAGDPATTRLLQATLGLARRHYGENRLAEAEALCREAVALAPGNADALQLLGVVIAGRGNPLLGLKHIDAALRLAPDNAAFLTNRGEILRRWGMPDEGLASCTRAVEIDPASPEGRNNLGLALLGVGRFAEAVPHLQAAIAQRPGMPQARLNLGRTLRGLQRWADAARALEDAVAAAPGYADAWLELALVREWLDDSAGSAAACERALEIRPAFPEALLALGDAQDALGAAGRATDAYRRALQVSPGYAAARYQLALCLLGEGQFAEGWALYESRTDPALPGAATPPILPMPRWQGEDPRGRKLLVVTEQGYGDHIQFARFVPVLANRGAEIVVAASPPLAALTATVEGVARVVTHIDDAWDSGCDYWAHIGSLPLRLGITADRIPADIPYLAAEPVRVRAWQARLAEYGRALKVGLCWAGRPTHGNDRRRSLPFERLAPLAGVPDAVFFSLQLGGRAADAEHPPAGMRVVPCGPWLSDFGDTAALLSCLDLLISVDSAPVHLAGALARPVWTLLPYQPDWRWRLDEDVSRWYPTMRLFRQQRPGDWDEVIARVVAALAGLARAAV